MERSKTRKPLARVVPFAITPERALERAARRFLRERTNRCPRCDSAFVSHEPAFVHCHYCGRIMRIANASLLAQELFEVRAGLRVAS